MNIRPFLLLAFLSWPGSLSARDWTDVTGQYRREGEFLLQRDGRVLLQQSNGRTCSIGLDGLCQSDREFVLSTTARLERKNRSAADAKDHSAGKVVSRRLYQPSRQRHSLPQRRPTERQIALDQTGWLEPLPDGLLLPAWELLLPRNSLPASSTRFRQAHLQGMPNVVSYRLSEQHTGQRLWHGGILGPRCERILSAFPGTLGRRGSLASECDHSRVSDLQVRRRESRWIDCGWRTILGNQRYSPAQYL